MNNSNKIVDHPGASLRSIKKTSFFMLLRKRQGNKPTMWDVKAFTLNEMLVVLLMTSIVVGMAFAVMNLVTQQMHSIEGNYERNTSLDLLRQSLWVDFNQFDGVWYDAKKEELLFSNELKEIKYKLYDDMVVKDLDTFFIAWKKQNFYFKTNSQISGEVDALDFVTSKENGTRRIFVFKRNAATTYMNQ